MRQAEENHRVQLPPGETFFPNHDRTPEVFHILRTVTSTPFLQSTDSNHQTQTLCGPRPVAFSTAFAVFPVTRSVRVHSKKKNLFFPKFPTNPFSSCPTPVLVASRPTSFSDTPPCDFDPLPYLVCHPSPVTREALGCVSELQR